MTNLAASDRSGLIIPVHLPAGLEALRRQGVADARRGLPAHVTLLYPFVAPEAIDDVVLASVASVVAQHGATELRLDGPTRWPDALVLEVGPAAPLRALQADLTRTFPAWPLYGGAHPFEPHVTIFGDAETGTVRSVASDDPAWAVLPAMAAADSVLLVVRNESGWTTRATFALGRPG